MELWLKYQEHLRNPPKNKTLDIKPASRKLLSLVKIPVLDLEEYESRPYSSKRNFTYQSLEEILQSGGRYTNEGHFPWEEKNVFGELEQVIHGDLSSKGLHRGLNRSFFN